MCKCLTLFFGSIIPLEVASCLQILIIISFSKASQEIVDVVSEEAVAANNHVYCLSPENFTRFIDIRVCPRSLFDRCCMIDSWHGIKIEQLLWNICCMSGIWLRGCLIIFARSSVITNRARIREKHPV